MKFAIERTALLKSMSLLQNVVERRTSIPILSHVKIKTEPSQLNFTATDMELSVEAQCPAVIDRPGATTVSAHMLFDIVRKLPDGSEVLIEQNENATEVGITAARSNFVLPSLPADDFPDMEIDELDVRFEIESETLKRLIDKTKFAISTEETRYYLNGIYFHTAEGQDGPVLIAVATDGHRLARAQIELPEGATGLIPMIVPRKAISEIGKLIEDIQGPVILGLSPKKIQLWADQAVLVSRLIDGAFPDYERVIPTTNDQKAFVDTRAFAQAVDRVATITTERARAVKLRFEEGTVTISAISSDTGRAVEELDCVYHGDSIEIGFNARYILDVLSEIEGDEVRIDMNNPAAPTLAQDPVDESILYVLMPMRV